MLQEHPEYAEDESKPPRPKKNQIGGHKLRYVFGGCLLFAANAFTQIVTMGDLNEAMSWAGFCMGIAVLTIAALLYCLHFGGPAEGKSKQVEYAVLILFGAGFMSFLSGFGFMAVALGRDRGTVVWIAIPLAVLGGMWLEHLFSQYK